MLGNKVCLLQIKIMLKKFKSVNIYNIYTYNKKEDHVTSVLIQKESARDLEHL